jgi:poly(3-hydroxybutyrate) depolymerase
MLETGPVSATKAETINNALEGAETVEEEREALVEELSEENYEMLFSEYHRIKGKRDNAENSVVLNRNWSFTSDSEPIFEFYIVEGGELQGQPIILDPDPETYNRQVNRPGSKEPRYLADLRDNTDWAQHVPQDYESVQGGIEFGMEENDATEEEVKDYRARALKKWSHVMFGVGEEPDVRPRDVETAGAVFEAMYSEGDVEILADLSNEYHEEDYDSDTLVEVELGDNGWKFHTPENRETGDPLIGEEERFS